MKCCFAERKGSNKLCYCNNFFLYSREIANITFNLFVIRNNISYLFICFFSVHNFIFSFIFVLLIELQQPFLGNVKHHSTILVDILQVAYTLNNIYEVIVVRPVGFWSKYTEIFRERKTPLHNKRKFISSSSQNTV